MVKGAQQICCLDAAAIRPCTWSPLVVGTLEHGVYVYR